MISLPGEAHQGEFGDLQVSLKGVAPELGSREQETCHSEVAVPSTWRHQQLRTRGRSMDPAYMYMC